MERFAMGLDNLSSNWDIPLRFALGIIFIGHGCRKLFGWFGGDGFDKTIQKFRELHLKPAPLMAALAGIGQVSGAMMLLFGLGTRLGALLILIEISVGIFSVHLKHGFFLNWENRPNKGHGVEYNAAILAMTLSLLIAGAGPLSVDAFLWRGNP